MIYNLYTKGDVDLKYIVSDLNGTLSIDGGLIDGVRERFDALNKLGFQIYVLTGDIHGNAQKLMANYACKIHVVDITEQYETQVQQKLKFIESLGADSVIAYGNGGNDALMLKAAAVGVHVCEREGGNVQALLNSDVTVYSIQDGLDLLIHPKRIAGH